MNHPLLLHNVCSPTNFKKCNSAFGIYQKETFSNADIQEVMKNNRAITISDLLRHKKEKAPINSTRLTSADCSSARNIRKCVQCPCTEATLKSFDDFNSECRVKTADDTRKFKQSILTKKKCSLIKIYRQGYQKRNLSKKAGKIVGLTQTHSFFHYKAQSLGVALKNELGDQGVNLKHLDNISEEI